MTPFAALVSIAEIMRTRDEQLLESPISVSVSQAESNSMWIVTAYVARKGDGPRELYTVLCEATDPEAALEEAAFHLHHRAEQILRVDYFVAKDVLET